MYLNERMYLQPQPRVWQEMQAQATVTPPPHLSALLLCLLRVPKEKLDKMVQWSVSRAFQRPGQAGPWFKAQKLLSPAHPQQDWACS